MTWEGLSPPYATIVVDPPWPHDDPPAGYQRQSGKERFVPYSLMSVKDIAALPVEELACYGAHLFLWTTARFLWDAKSVVEAWGFRVAQPLVWAKPPSGLGPGGMFANTTEFILYARRKLVAPGHLIREEREKAGLGQGELHRLIRGDAPTGIVYLWEQGKRTPNAEDWSRLCEALPGLAERAGSMIVSDPFKGRVDSSWWEWPQTQHSTKPPAFLDIVEQVTPGPYVELFARAPRLGWDSYGWGFESEPAKAV